MSTAAPPTVASTTSTSAPLPPASFKGDAELDEYQRNRLTVWAQRLSTLTPFVAFPIDLLQIVVKYANYQCEVHDDASDIMQLLSRVRFVRRVRAPGSNMYGTCAVSFDAAGCVRYEMGPEAVDPNRLPHCDVGRYCVYACSMPQIAVPPNVRIPGGSGGAVCVSGDRSKNLCVPLILSFGERATDFYYDGPPDVPTYYYYGKLPRDWDAQPPWDDAKQQTHPLNGVAAVARSIAREGAALSAFVTDLIPPPPAANPKGVPHDTSEEIRDAEKPYRLHTSIAYVTFNASPIRDSKYVELVFAGITYNQAVPPLKSKSSFDACCIS